MVSAVRKCLEIVDNQSDIVLDIIVMFPDRVPISTGNLSTIFNYYRIKDMKHYHSLLDDVSSFMRAYPDVDYRYFVQASEQPEPEWDLLSFGKATIEKMIKLGQKDAKKIYGMGAGVSFEIFSSNHHPGQAKKQVVPESTNFLQ